MSSPELDKSHDEIVSELRERIAELEANDRFRLVVESAPNGIILIAPSGRITMVNQRAEELFGYTREEFSELRIEALVPDRFRRAHGSLRKDFLTDPISMHSCKRDMSSPSRSL